MNLLKSITEKHFNKEEVEMEKEKASELSERFMVESYLELLPAKPG
jgi:hypothetical protein